MNPKIPVPEKEERQEFFTDIDNLQNYQFYDNNGKELRYLDSDMGADNSHIYLFEYVDEKDKDKELKKYYDSTPLFYEFKDRTNVPFGEKRYEFFSEKTYDDLQKYRFYDATGKKLRYSDTGREADNSRIYLFNVVDPVKYDDNAPLYFKEIKDIDKKSVEHRTADPTGAEKKPSLKHTISSTEIKDIDKKSVEHRTADPTGAEKKPSFRDTISSTEIKDMSPKIPVPSGETERSEFFRKIPDNDLQKYRFYDVNGNTLRYVDITYVVKEGSKYSSTIYIFKDNLEKRVKYTGTTPLYYKKPSFKNTISSTIRRSFRRHTTAKKSPRKGGKNRRTSNNKQKTRKTRKQ